MSVPKLAPGDSMGNASRRLLLRSLIALPVIASPWVDALASLQNRYDDAAVSLRRSRAGRSLSLHRYHSAETEFSMLGAGFLADRRYVRETLHQAGAIAKLALCSYLLDVGFSDAWNAIHIQQDITKALAYANATGFDHACPEMARLAETLSPFWKWGYPQMIGRPPLADGGFDHVQIRAIIRALLDQVRHVTGHVRPAVHRRSDACTP